MNGRLGEGGDAVHVGENIVRFEAPDLVHVIFVGSLPAAALTQILQEIHQFSAGKERIFILADMRRGSFLSSEGRKAGMDAPVNIRGVALVSSSFPLRALATLLSKAFMLLHPEVDLDISFCESEGDARAWLDERRRKVVARAARGE